MSFSDDAYPLNKSWAAAHDIYDDTTSSEEDVRKYPFFVPRSRRVARRYAVVLCLIAVLIIVLCVCLPWGHAAYNENLDEGLRRFSLEQKNFTSVCLIKQYNGLQEVPLFAGRLVGKHSPDLCGLYHHEGVLLEVGNSDGSSAFFLQLDFGHYGLKYYIQGAATAVDLIPWEADCQFRCGIVPPAQGDPRKLADLLRTMRDQGYKYNGITFNCLEFSQLIWDHFAPGNTGCGPEVLNQWAESRRSQPTTLPL
mmetsp:Transcript_64785/g.141125  ORF Transcript_64785/g.141125 Transcript_64785/m.141125 type:complete len:252 (+) Transcript_64785:32-787(+)